MQSLPFSVPAGAWLDCQICILHTNTQTRYSWRASHFPWSLCLLLDGFQPCSRACVYMYSKICFERPLHSPWKYGFLGDRLIALKFWTFRQEVICGPSRQVVSHGSGLSRTGVTVCLKWHRGFGLELSPVITWPSTLDIFVPAHKYMYYHWYYHCEKGPEHRTVKAINMKLLIKLTQSKQMLKRFLTAVKVQCNRYCETYMWNVLPVPVLKTALIQVWIPTIGHSQSKDSDFSQSQASCFYSNFSQ